MTEKVRVRVLRQYSEQEKRHAVGLVVDHERSIPEVAYMLNIPKETLYCWVHPKNQRRWSYIREPKKRKVKEAPVELPFPAVPEPEDDVNPWEGIPPLLEEPLEWQTWINWNAVIFAPPKPKQEQP
jgi:transposase-like protein